MDDPASFAAAGDLSNPSPEQISVGESPRTQNQRRRIVMILVHGILGLLAVTGVHRVWTATTDSEYVIGGVLVAMGAVQASVLTIRAMRRVRGNRRLMRGRCPSCGYEMMAFATGRCPECGADPFDW